MATLTGQVHSQVQEAEPWLRVVARLGYLAKGLVYAAIGILALLAATGNGGRAADPKDAVNFLAGLPFGQAIVGVVAIGLLGYALWKALEAIRNPERQKPLKRVAFLISAVAYGALGIAALAAARGGRATGSAEGTARTVLNQPGGQWWLALAGVVVLGMAVNSFVKAAKASFMEHLQTEAMSAQERHVAKVVGRLGHTARGVVFLPIGFFLIRSGLNADSREAGGIEQALRSLSHAAYGPWLLGLVALGLIAYAASLAVEARYRRMTPIS